MPVIPSDLARVRQLHFKIKLELAKGTSTKYLSKLEDQVTALNFECDDGVCTNGMAAQGKVRRLLGTYMHQLYKWRPQESHQASLKNIAFDTARQLGLAEARHLRYFVDKLEAYLEDAADLEVNEQRMYDYDRVTFDIVSGVFQFKRTLTSITALPGSLMRGLIDGMLE